MAVITIILQAFGKYHDGDFKWAAPLFPFHSLCILRIHAIASRLVLLFMRTWKQFASGDNYITSSQLARWKCLEVKGLVVKQESTGFKLSCERAGAPLHVVPVVLLSKPESQPLEYCWYWKIIIEGFLKYGLKTLHFFILIFSKCSKCSEMKTLNSYCMLYSVKHSVLREDALFHFILLL